MGTKLDQLLERIDPACTIDKYEARAHEAFNSFEMPADGVQTREDFQNLLARLEFHLLTTRTGCRKPFPVKDQEFWYGHMHERLIEEYGLQGARVAFEMASTGVDGGLYGVLTTMVARFGRKWAEKIIASEVLEYCHGLSTDERLAAPQEYLEKFRRLLPSDIRHGLDYRLAREFWRVLEQHPHLIRRMRRIGR